MAVKFKLSTLNKCDEIAYTMNPKRYMSLDGLKLVEIIKLLLPESNGQPGVVCAQLVAIGRAYGWDLPRISAAGEAGWLLWLVMEVAKTVTAAPVPAVVAAAPRETAAAYSGPTLPGRRRR